MTASAARLCSLATIALAIVALSACGKSKSEKPKPQAAPTAKAAEPTKSAAPAAPKTDGREKLAAAYHEIRCMLTGARRPDIATYTEHGFTGAAAFSKAFSDAATKDADWAATTIAASIKRGCKEAEAGK